MNHKKLIIMKKFIIILFLLTSFFTATAQKKMDKPYVIWSSARPVISILNLRTGETVSSPALKENPISVIFNKEQNKIYATTKHFGYQLDVKTCEILIKFQFTDILQKKAGELIDPNLMLMPVGLNDEGIGFFYNMNESIQNKINGEPATVTLKRFDIANKTVNDFTVFDSDKYFIRSTQNNFLIREHNYQSGNNNFTIDKIGIEKYYIIETLSIPIQLPENKFNLKLNDIININYKKTEKDTITLSLTKTNSDFTSVKLFLYSYNTKEKKPISLKEDKVPTFFNCGLDCKNTYVAKLIIPEKPPMPKAPEVYKPTKYNKKARAEAERINDERLKEFKRQLKEWGEKNSDRSNNITNLYIIENGEKKLLKSFQGVTGITVYEDRYAFYNDDLEYIMYDLEKDTILWSILK